MALHKDYCYISLCSQKKKCGKDNLFQNELQIKKKLAQIIVV